MIRLPRILRSAGVALSLVLAVVTGFAANDRRTFSTSTTLATEASTLIKLLEEEGDGIYHAAVGALFDADGGRPDPLEVMKWKEIYETVEEAIDKCEDIAHTLETILVKQA